MIALSLLTLRPGRMGGSEGYVRGLTAALARVGGLEYVCVVAPDAVDAAGGLPTRVAGGSSERNRVAVFGRATLASRAHRGADVVHYPITVPLPVFRGPRVVTLADVLHLDHPELVSLATRVRRAVLYDRAARGADRVIVPSVFTRDRVVARLGVDPARIRVVPHGLDHARFRPGGDERDPFLVYPARPWPHKNHDILLAALARVRERRPEVELVLTGAGLDGSTPEGVRRLGVVRAEEVAALYRRASALVFPSLYEGFGWPVLEAMASGCPVAVARGNAAEELAGDAAVLFDPTSEDDVAAGILRVLDEGPRLVERGLERAGAYSWERCARAHEDVYSELLD
jgi:glycosyltransferase involved in cell wall biosynthesis